VSTQYTGESEQMANDGEELLNFLMPDAVESLEKNGEVLPRAAVVTPEGEIRLIEAPEAADRSPEEAFAGLCDQIRKGGFRSAGLCFDVHLVREEADEHSDAIRVYLETNDGAVMNVFMPYETSESGEVVTGEIFATEGEPQIFTS